MPIWINWPPVFRGLILLWRWFHSQEREDESPYIRSSRARQLMEPVGLILSESGFPWQPSDPGPRHGERYWPVFENDIRSLVGILKPEIEAVTAASLKGNNL